MHFKKHYIVLILFLFWIGALFAQTSTVGNVYFRAGKSTIDSEFSNNAERLSAIISFLKTTIEDSSLVVTSIEFSGMASPEGSMDFNYNISRQRMKLLEHYIRSRVEIPDNLISHRDRRVSWEYLDSLVVSSDMSYRNEVSTIIRNTPIFIYKQDKIVDGRKKQLMDLNYGVTWNEMERRFFHSMRTACAVVITCEKVIPKRQELKKDLPPVEEKAEPDPIIEEKEEVSTILVETPPEVIEWTRHLYLKTNTIGLGMLIANAAVEIDLSKHWSFTLPIYYSAWNYTTHTKKLRTLAVQPEVRYWLTGNNGWFMGAHFGMAYYNFAWDGDYRFQDYNRSTPAIGGGLGVGYRLPVSNRLKMEFSLGGGVYDLHYDKFHNEHNGLLIESMKKTFFGIDQVTVSFSYMFDLKKKRR